MQKIIDYFCVALLCLSSLVLLWQQKLANWVLTFTERKGSEPKVRAETRLLEQALMDEKSRVIVKQTGKKNPGPSLVTRCAYLSPTEAAVLALFFASPIHRNRASWPSTSRLYRLFLSPLKKKKQCFLIPVRCMKRPLTVFFKTCLFQKVTENATPW